MSELVPASLRPRPTAAASVLLATSMAPELVPIVCDGRKSVAKILAEIGFDGRDWTRLTVTIADQEVPRAMWGRVRPKPESELLMMVTVRPLGGDGGNTLKIVLGVLLIAGAIAITGGALGFTIGGALDIGLGGAGGLTLFGAGSFESYLLAAAVVGLGQAGINALFPSAVKSKDDRSALGQAGAKSNVLVPGDWLTRPFGTVKVWPRQVTKPIRYFEGRDEVVEALYAVAGKVALRDVRVGGAPASEVDGITVQVVDFNAPLEQQTLLQQYGAVKAVGRPLQWYRINKDAGDDLADQSVPERTAPAWDTVSFPDGDQMRLRLAWTEGLNKRNDNSAQVHQAMRIRLRPRSGGAWVNLPEIWWSNNESAAAYRKDVIIERGPVRPQVPITDAKKTAAQFLARVPGQGQYALDGADRPNGSGNLSTVAQTVIVTAGNANNPAGTGYPTLGAPSDGQLRYVVPRRTNTSANPTLTIDGVTYNTNVGIGGFVEDVPVRMTWSAANTRFQISGGIGNNFVGFTFTPKTADWIADAHFYSGTYPAEAWRAVAADQNVQALDEGAVFYITEAMLPRGPVEMQVIAGAVLVPADIDFSKYATSHWTYTGTSVRDNFGWTQHDGHAPKYGPNAISDKSGPVAVNELVAINRAEPLTGLTKSEIATISIRGRNVQVGDVTAIATSIVYDRRNGAWVETDNPALLSESLARGENTHRGVAAGSIDEAAYDAWADHCTANGLMVGFEVAGGRWDQVQQHLASGGYGGFAAHGSFRPYFDRDRSAESAVMVFNPANSRFVSLGRSVPAIPTDALRVSYADAADDFADAQRIVYAPGITAASARGIEDVRYPELIDSGLVTSRALYDMAVNRHRALRMVFETDHAAEAVRKGDLAIFLYNVLAPIDAEHEVNELPLSQSAYIKSVTRNLSDQITEIALDAPVYVEPSSDDFLAVPDALDVPNVDLIGRPLIAVVTVGGDGSQAGYTVELDLDVGSAGATDTLTIVPASPLRADLIAAGQILSVGRADRLRRRCIIESIVPSGPFFEITVVPEAPEIFQ